MLRFSASYVMMSCHFTVDEPEGGASTSSSDGIGQEKAVTLESKL